MSSFRCPSCSAAIAMDDVNVAKDIALCRACGKTTSFAGLQDSSELAKIDLTTPPRHVTITQDPKFDLSLNYHRKSRTLFFPLWVAESPSERKSSRSSAGGGTEMCQEGPMNPACGQGGSR